MKRFPWQGVMAGALAGVAGALAMNQFQRVAARAGHGREADDATIGLPRTGRGPQPAQAIGNASDDGTAKVANAALSVVGHELTDPRATAAGGVPFGASLWAVADEGAVPALGLSRGPREASAGLLAYGLLSHCVFGITTELVRKSIRRA